MTDGPSPRRPPADQGELLAAGEVDRPVRPVEAAVAKSIDKAELSDLYAGAGALAVAIARAVDVSVYRKDPYGVAAAARELREQLIRLRLDPASVDAVDDGVRELLEEMAKPDVGAG